MNEIAYSSHEEWLEIRSHYVGGSDAAAVVGLSPYKSAYTLWAEKTGRVPSFEGNLTTRVGSYLEDLVAGLWCEETSKQVRRKNRVLVNPEYPFAAANLDRVVVGERALLEIKTTNSFPTMRKCRSGDFPEQWYCQVMHYMAVTGYERAYLAVLLNCRDLLTYELERDEDEIRALMDAERDFWQHVTDGTPPVIDGSESTAATVDVLTGSSAGQEIPLLGRTALLDEYTAIKRQKKALDERATQIENIIKMDMGSAEKAVEGSYTVSWKSQTRRTFQADAFRKDHPDEDLDPYYKTSNSRPFKVTFKEAV